MAGKFGALDFSCSYNGLTLTDAENFMLKSIAGWDALPGLDKGDQARPASPGAWPGRLRPQSRFVTVQGELHSDPDSVREFVQAVEDAWRTTDVESPLVVTMGADSRMLLARVVERETSGGPELSVGWPVLTVQFEAADPLRYSPSWSTASTPLPQPPAGVDWDFTWDVDWGDDEGSSGRVTAVNSGNRETPARVMITGSVSSPSVAIGDQVLTYNLTVAEGNAMLIDAKTGVARLTSLTQAANAFLADPFDTALGQDCSGNLANRSITPQDLMIPRGATELAFLSDGTGTGVMRVAWRSAYL